MPDNRFAILICPSCQGVGTVGGILCPTCERAGVLVRIDGRAYRWRYSLSGAGVAVRKTKRLAESIFVSFFLTLGLIGLLAFAWVLIGETQKGAAFSPTFWAKREGALLFFWCSLLGDLFLYSFVEGQLARAKTLPVIRNRDTSPRTDLSPEDFRALIRGSEDLAQFFAPRALHLLEEALSLAVRLTHHLISPLHLWAVLLGEPSVVMLFARLQITPSVLAEKLGRLLVRNSPADVGEQGVTSEDFNLSLELREGLAYAVREALAAQRPSVGPVELLLGAAANNRTLADLLADLELSFEKLRRVAYWYWASESFSHTYRLWRRQARRKPKGVMNRSWTALATPFLDRISGDLTRQAARGLLFPTVGRAGELEAIFRSLSGGRSVLLIGEDGVGKTALLAAIAEHMAAEDVPETLFDKRLLLMDVPRLVAGASHVGELEERASTVLAEAVRAGNVVLAVENIEHLMGVRSTGEELDLGSIVADAVAGGRILAVGTTTPEAYRRSLEGTALAEAFTTVEVREPSEDEAIEVIESRIPFLEGRFHTQFSYEAVERSVQLARRYLHDVALPGKVLRLLEELGASVRKGLPVARIITGEDVAKLVAQKTNIPVTRVTEKESERLLNLEEELHERIVGQDEAVRAVAAALRRARTEIRDPHRPIASFLFLGPTGVGKTETAKAVAATYFGSEENMVRLDMSEYQNLSSLYQLLGAPAGMGEGGGYLTEAVRKHPFSLILLDEFEKAHPDILNIFLQIMDDGRATDGGGRTVDFTNVIIIATSNAGTALIQQGIREGQDLRLVHRQLWEQVLPQYFRPELLNRFDGVIIFRPLTQEEIQSVARLLISQVISQLATKGITLQVTDEALVELAEAGFDPTLGARPLRRVIQERVEGALATFLLSGRLSRRDVAVLHAGGTIEVRKAEPI